MDLNYLFHRHQVSMMRASAASRGSEAAFAHRALATAYAGRIAALQDRSGAHAPFVPA